MKKTLLPLLLVIGLIAGCGSDSDTDSNNAYVAKVNAAQTEFSTSAGRVAAGIGGDETTADFRKTVRAFQKAIDTAVTRLRAIDVPEKVTAEHKQIVDAMVGFGKDVQEAGDTLRDPTPTRLAQVPGAMQRAATTVNQRIRTATSAINSKLGAS